MVEGAGAPLYPKQTEANLESWTLEPCLFLTHKVELLAQIDPSMVDVPTPRCSRWRADNVIAQQGWTLERAADGSRMQLDVQGRATPKPQHQRPHCLRQPEHRRQSRKVWSLVWIDGGHNVFPKPTKRPGRLSPGHPQPRLRSNNCCFQHIFSKHYRLPSPPPRVGLCFLFS